MSRWSILNNESEICGFCHIGQLIETRLTYTERFQKELILVSNIPARVCSYCGEKQYNSFVMNTLRRLLWTDLRAFQKKFDRMRTYSYRIDPQFGINKGPSPSDGN